jgi:hypothetical protein
MMSSCLLRTFRGYLPRRNQNRSAFARTPRKTPSPIVVGACLPLRCLATDFLYLRTFARRGPQRKHSFPSIVACIRVYKTVP